jgi:hypothetical protein
VYRFAGITRRTPTLVATTRARVVISKVLVALLTPIGVAIKATRAVCVILYAVIVPPIRVVAITGVTVERVILVATLTPILVINCVSVVQLVRFVAILTDERAVVAIDRVIVATGLVLWNYISAGVAIVRAGVADYIPIRE